MQDTELLTIHDRRMRDLVWAVGVPPLVRPVAPASGLRHSASTAAHQVPYIVSDSEHWVSYDFFLGAYRRALRAVRTGEVPSPPNRAGRRLGRYFEDLLAHWFACDPEVELVARDIPVRDANRTVGQLDFVIDTAGQRLHLEVAVKFYLRLGSVDQLDRYVGLDLSDRLDLKLSHMLFHQRGLAQSPPGRRTLAQRLNTSLPDRSVASIRGILFDPLPPAAGNVLPRYFWATEQQFLGDPRCAARVWTHASRGQWFSPVRSDEASWLPADRIDPFAEKDARTRPVLLIGRSDSDDVDGESTRAVIVQNGF